MERTKGRVPKRVNWGGCICGTAIVAAIVSIVAIALAITAWQVGNQAANAREYQADQQLRSSPFYHTLRTGPLSMTLPNDLSGYVGRTYRVDSIGAAAHTITIESGSLGTTWDGTNTVATFAGAKKGEGFSFRVVDKDLIRIETTDGVTFV